MQDRPHLIQQQQTKAQAFNWHKFMKQILHQMIWYIFLSLFTRLFQKPSQVVEHLGFRPINCRIFWDHLEALEGTGSYVSPHHLTVSTAVCCAFHHWYLCGYATVQWGEPGFSYPQQQQKMRGRTGVSWPKWPFSNVNGSVRGLGVREFLSFKRGARADGCFCFANC